MRVALIADGSTRIGGGHQVRMSTLARTLMARGHAVEMRCRDLPGSLHAWCWSGLPIRLTDAGTTADALLDPPTDWLVVDHYEVRGHPLTRRANGHLLLVQDIVEPPCSADLILNQNLGVDASAYPTGSLVGPDYVLLREPFRSRQWKGGGGTLVMCGATDHLDLLPAITAVLQQKCAKSHSTLHIVGGRPPVGCHAYHRLDAEPLAELMVSCDRAVLAAGSSVYEALAIGIPFVAIRTADNQNCIAHGLRQLSVPVLSLDELHMLPDTLDRALPRYGIVDGLGPDRVVSAMERRR